MSAALTALIPVPGSTRGPQPSQNTQGSRGLEQALQRPHASGNAHTSRGAQSSGNTETWGDAQTSGNTETSGNTRARPDSGQAQGSQSHAERKVIDFNANVMRSVPGMPDSVMRLIGNVVLHHNGAVLTCDSAYRFGDKHFECYGRVLINKDSTFIYGDKAVYDGYANTARVLAPLVKVVDGDAVLYTFNFSFNTLDNVGRYWGRGTMTQKENRLESQRGYYYADTREFTCVEDVEATDPEYKMVSDSVRYNMGSETADFFTPTTIWNIKDEIISASRGTYHNADARYEFTRDTYLLTKTREVLCDSLDYESRPGNAVMMSNIQMRDDEQKIMAFGDYGRYVGESENAMMTRNPSVLSFDPEQDTIYMRSDSMFLFSFAYELDFDAYDSLRRGRPADIGAEVDGRASADSTLISLPEGTSRHREDEWPQPESPAMREALREMVVAQKYALFEQGGAITRESLTPEMVDSLLNTGYSSEDIEGQILYNERKRELEEQGLPVTQSLVYDILESIGAFGNPLPPPESEIIRDSLRRLEEVGRIRNETFIEQDSTGRGAEGLIESGANRDSTVVGATEKIGVVGSGATETTEKSDAKKTEEGPSKDSTAGVFAGSAAQDSTVDRSDAKGGDSSIESAAADDKRLSRRERRRQERERESVEKQTAKSEKAESGSASAGTADAISKGDGDATAGNANAKSKGDGDATAGGAGAAQNIDAASLRDMLESVGIDMDSLLEDIRLRGMSALTDTLLNKLQGLGVDPRMLVPQGFTLPTDSIPQSSIPSLPPGLPAVPDSLMVPPLDFTAFPAQDSLSHPEQDSLAAAAPVAHDSLQRVIFGYNNVRIFRNDMQAVCDSLVVFSKDSTAHLYIDPVMWNKQNQITAEVIDIYTKNQQLERAFFSGWPLMVSEVDSTQYNQIKGREMESFFRDDEIYKHTVTGNAQTLYYMLDEASGEANTFMVVNSSSIAFIMEDQQIIRITWFKDNDAVGHPIERIPLDVNRFLDGFRWEIARKPGLKDVFDRTIRPSRREYFEALPHPIFPITDFIEQEKKKLTESGVWEDRTDTLPPHAIEFLHSIGVTQ